MKVLDLVKYRQKRESDLIESRIVKLSQTSGHGAAAEIKLHFKKWLEFERLAK